MEEVLDEIYELIEERMEDICIRYEDNTIHFAIDEEPYRLTLGLGDSC